MSEVSDPGSLTLLHDIVLPDAVSWWPPAEGWYVVTILLLLATATGAWWGWQRWQTRRYRRQALEELRALRQASDDPGATASNILILLKRTALAAYPRAQVAQLNGEQWWAFLDRTSSGNAFTSDFGPLATDLAYRAEAHESDPHQQLGVLFNTAEHWIVTHHEPAGD